MSDRDWEVRSEDDFDGHSRFIERLERVASKCSGLGDEFSSLWHSPRVDETYKVARMSPDYEALENAEQLIDVTRDLLVRFMESLR